MRLKLLHLLERERDLQVQHLLLQLPLLRGEDRPLLLLSRARQLGGVAQVTQAGWRLRTQESGRALELQILLKRHYSPF